MRAIVRMALPICFLGGAAGLAAAWLSGCEAAPAPPPPVAPYLDQGYKPDLPTYMRGTVFERTDTGNTQPYPVTGYSLCVNLQGTGDNSSIPTAVREALIKKLALTGFGQHNDPRFTNLQPEQVLADKRVAVVQVIGLLPVGARRGQQFDVVVRAMPRSRTTSLAHGHLYNTELRNRGLDLPSSGGTILGYADAGDVFVNPVYALNGPAKPEAEVNSAQVAASLRSGVVMNAGRVTEDRSIFLQLRVPQASISRAIERRVNNRFPAGDQDRPAAAAQDEGLIDLYVPLSFAGDWRHFLEVVNHLYVNDSPDFSAKRTALLMSEAHKPAAALTDISYCLEALGPTAVPMYRQLFSDPDPAVAYAAARAAAFNSDSDALEVLEDMADEADHPFQLAAVRTLGELPRSPAVDKRLEPLLASDKTLVRIEAYKILAAHEDRRIITRDLPDGYKLDIVDTGGAPLIWASRTGVPRLAIFGPTMAISPPVIFTAMDDRLTISSDDMGEYVTVFYRDPRQAQPVKLQSGLPLEELMSRLGGMGPPNETPMDLSYCEAVAIVEALASQHAVVEANVSGQLAAAPFMIDQPREMTDAIVTAALNARPQSDPIHSTPKAKPADSGDSTLNGTGPLPSFTGSAADMSSSPSLGAGAPESGSGGGGSPSVPSFGNP